jgi:hypothetical protein
MLAQGIKIELILIKGLALLEILAGHRQKKARTMRPGFFPQAVWLRAV